MGVQKRIRNKRVKENHTRTPESPLYRVSIFEKQDWSCLVTYSLVDKKTDEIMSKDKIAYTGIEAAVHAISDYVGRELTDGIPCEVGVIRDSSSNAISIYQYLSDNPKLSIHPNICDYTCGEYYIVEYIQPRKEGRYLIDSESVVLTLWPFYTYEQAERFAEMVETRINKALKGEDSDKS